MTSPDDAERAEDRLPIIKECLDGLLRGKAEPLFPGDIQWLTAELERLRQREAALREGISMVAEEREMWKARALGLPLPRCVHEPDLPEGAQPEHAALAQAEQERAET